MQFVLSNYSLILMKFTNTIVKSRPLKEIGAEQVFILKALYKIAN